MGIKVTAVQLSSNPDFSEQIEYTDLTNTFDLAHFMRHATDEDMFDGENAAKLMDNLYVVSFYWMSDYEGTVVYEVLVTEDK